MVPSVFKHTHCTSSYPHLLLVCTQAAAFDSWLEAVHGARYNRQVLTKAVKRITNLRLSQAFQQWSLQTGTLREAREKAAQIIVHMQHQSLASAFNSWHAAVAESQQAAIKREELANNAVTRSNSLLQGQTFEVNHGALRIVNVPVPLELATLFALHSAATSMLYAKTSRKLLPFSTAASCSSACKAFIYRLHTKLLAWAGMEAKGCVSGVTAAAGRHEAAQGEHGPAVWQLGGPLHLAALAFTPHCMQGCYPGCLVPCCPGMLLPHGFRPCHTSDSAGQSELAQALS